MQILQGPALREVFGIPILICQIYFMVAVIQEKKTSDYVMFTILTVLLFITWQFSTYLLIAEIISVYIVKFISNRNFNTIILVLLVPISLTFIMGSGSDNHVINYFLFRIFGKTPDFSSMLYYCNGGFTSAQFSSIALLLDTGVIFLGIFGVITYYIVSANKNDSILFLATLTLIFFAIGYTVSRFLVLFIPLICVLSALSFNKEIWSKIANKNVSRTVNLVLFLFITSINRNLIRDKVVSVSDPRVFVRDFDEINLMQWIEGSTDENSVFAGPMSTNSQVALITKRKICNNPFYENVSNRKKTYDLYRIYGKEKFNNMYNILLKNGVTHLIVDGGTCLQDNGTVCNTKDLYIHEDAQNDNPILCRVIDTNLDKNRMRKVFENRQFRVYKIIKN